MSGTGGDLVLPGSVPGGLDQPDHLTKSNLAPESLDTEDKPEDTEDGDDEIGDKTDTPASPISLHGDGDWLKPDAKHDVRPIAGKGLGLCARVDIPAITTILEERPVLTCQAGAKSVEEMEGYMVAALSRIPEDDQNFIVHCLTNMTEDKVHHLAGCYRTNALPCPPDRDVGAIFKTIAMANHSCVPNARYEWVPSAGSGRLVALEHIPADSEITISYAVLETHAVRRAALRRMFGFDCACPLCSMSKKERRAEDRRIREIDGLELTLLSDPRRTEREPARSLHDFAKLLDLYHESRINHERDILAAYAEVIRLCNVCFTTPVAVREVERVCGFSREEAREACREWYATFFGGNTNTDDDDGGDDDDKSLEFLSRAAPLFQTADHP